MRDEVGDDAPVDRSDTRARPCRGRVRLRGGAGRPGDSVGSEAVRGVWCTAVVAGPQQDSEGRRRLLLEPPAEPEQAVPRGRLHWTAPPGRHAVYSIQHRAVWDALDGTGVFELRDSSFFNAPEFSPAYEWMRVQIQQRLGLVMGDSWPIWGWSRATRASMVEGCRLSPGEVLLRLEVPREAVLESDFDAWHAALNGVPLIPPEVHPDTAEWDAWEEESERLLASSDSGAIQATWTRMFDVSAWGSAASAQAALPVLRASWVTSATQIAPA